jgi:ubiquitin-activating enzyme E1
VQKPAELNKILQQADSVVATLLAHPQGPSFAKTVKRAIRMLRARPSSYADCVRAARLKFEHYFASAAKQLLHLFPLNHTVKDGVADVPFWTPPKVPPVPLVFDAAEPLHVSFVFTFANLLAAMWKLPQSQDPSEAARVAANTAVPAFVPREGKVVETDPSKKQAEAAATVTSQDEFAKLCHTLSGLLQSSPRGIELAPTEFEKDVDANFHVDFVAACANLRAANYGIKPVERLEAKRIAGRIIPAIATTTSVVSAHVALELIKIVSKATLDEYRNLNTNLALPFFLFSTPDEAMKKHIGDVAYTKWDSWEVRTLGLDATVEHLIAHFRDEYGLAVQSVCHGTSIVYHEDFASETHETLRELLLDVPKSAKWVPLTVMFHGKGDEVCSGPAVKFFLKKAIKKRRT